MVPIIAMYHLQFNGSDGNEGVLHKAPALLEYHHQII